MRNEFSIHPKPDELKWFLLQKKVREDRVKRAFGLFRSHGIEPILIKGWAVGLSYPDDIPRYFNDTDLAVAAEDYTKAARLSGEPEAQGILIDLHRELRDLDTVPWRDLFDNSRLIDLDGEQIRVLRPEDHLRVLAVHWLLDGGAYKERLWDLYYPIAHRSADFDWDRCLGVVPKHRRRWIVAAIAIVHHYLGLPIDDLPFAEEARHFPLWMQRCIESEWRSNVRLEPVIIHLRSPVKLLQQLWKRMPPNPIRATIEMEGSIDARRRVPYQLRCMARMLTHPRGSMPASVEVGKDGDD